MGRSAAEADAFQHEEGHHAAGRRKGGTARTRRGSVQTHFGALDRHRRPVILADRVEPQSAGPDRSAA